MNIIICGAGAVGLSMARFLSASSHMVTIVDASLHLIRKVEGFMEARGIVGHASHPDVLREAGADEADLIVAVTRDDEVNILTCQAAHALFDVPRTVARVRARSYRDKAWSELFSRTNLSVDTIISPEIDIAQAITRCLSIPGVSEAVPFFDGGLLMLGFRCDADCPIINTPLRQLTTLFPDLAIALLRIRRNDRWLAPRGNEMMLEGDLVRAVVDQRQLSRVLEAFGKTGGAPERVTILGAGQIGASLSGLLDVEDHIRTILIERNVERAQQLAAQLDHVQVLCGDFSQEIIEEANIQNSDVFVAATGSDQDNFVACLLAKHMGAKKVAALVGQSMFQGLMSSYGVDIVVNPESVTISSILPVIRPGRIYGAYALPEAGGEIMEIQAMEASKLVGAKLRDLRMPAETMIVAAGHDKEKIRILRRDDQILSGERILLFTPPGADRQIEELLRVQI